MKTFIALAAALVLVLSACASSESFAEPGDETTTTSTKAPPDTTTTPPPVPRVLVVTITEEGGCFMMGPNCATYVAYSDGSVELMRTGDTGNPEATTTVDPDLIADIQDLLASTDLDALRATLPGGECQGCFDGIDSIFTYETPDRQVSFASIDVELIVSEPLFAATWNLLDELAANVELPIRERP